MKGFLNSIKQNFIAGIIVIIPFGLTAFILYKLIRWIVKIFSKTPAKILAPLTELPQSVFEIITFSIGIFTTLFLVLFIGALARNYLGRRLVGFGEVIISKIPFARTLYIAIKQIIETLFFTADMKNLKRVGMVEYPRKGIRSIGFITGSTEPGQHHNKTDQNLVSIFIPTTPNPTSGYYIMVPKEDVIELDISVEDAFRLIVSAGLSTNKIDDSK